MSVLIRMLLVNCSRTGTRSWSCPRRNMDWYVFKENCREKLKLFSKACRGLNTQGSGTETWVKSCGQWVLQQRPNVVINSWGGGQGLTFYNGVIRAWRAAGIIPVFSIGNQGSGGCGTSNSPGDQPGVISVGSTMSNDSISAFSSKGYSIQGRLKPEVT